MTRLKFKALLIKQAMMLLLCATALMGGGSSLVFASGTVARSVTFPEQINSTSSNWKAGLKTGQLLLTESPKPLNFLILTMYPQFSPFFHVGIVEVDNGQIFVYEANGEVDKLSVIAGLGGDRAPSDFITGHVKKVTLDAFLAESRTISVFNPLPAANIQNLISFASRHASAKTPFDAYFDSADHSRLYCSEFVALALDNAGSGGNFLVQMRDNNSLQKVLTWMKVPNRTIIPAYKLVSLKNWVGTVSLDFSELELQIDRAIKLELYQRFSANQKVGNVVNLGGNDDYVKEIKQFRKVAFALFANQKTHLSADEIVKKVRHAADNVLGPMHDRYRTPYSRCSINLSNC